MTPAEVSWQEGREQAVGPLQSLQCPPGRSWRLPRHLLTRGSRGPKPSLAQARQALAEASPPLSPPDNDLLPAKGSERWARELTVPERLLVSLPCHSGLGVSRGLPTQRFHQL